ncbi:MAG: hypothetical protein V4509_00575 [Patescibacteria group bacterium]
MTTQNNNEIDWKEEEREILKDFLMTVPKPMEFIELCIDRIASHEQKLREEIAGEIESKKNNINSNESCKNCVSGDICLCEPFNQALNLSASIARGKK